MRYRKKPVEIEAIQWNGNLNELLAWADGHNRDMAWEFRNEVITIPTLEGRMTAKKGDWIIWGVKGEFYPCDPEIFAMTYEAVGDA